MFEFRIDPEAAENLHRAFDDLRAAAEITSAMMRQSLLEFISALHITLAYASPRQQAAEKRGYDLPDWVWKVEEMQRRTFGSGNGRIMRP